MKFITKLQIKLINLTNNLYIYYIMTSSNDKILNNIMEIYISDENEAKETIKKLYDIFYNNTDTQNNDLSTKSKKAYELSTSSIGIASKIINLLKTKAEFKNNSKLLELERNIEEILK